MIRSALSIVALPLLLGGCSIVSTSDTKCMKIALVTSMSKVPLSRVIAGDGREVIISSFKGGCEGSSPQLPGGDNEIGIMVTLITPEAKHSTGEVKEVTLPLFVALLDKQDNVKDRFDQNIKVAISDHALNHIHKMIYHPPEGIGVDNQDYHILVGFNSDVSLVP